MTHNPHFSHPLTPEDVAEELSFEQMMPTPAEAAAIWDYVATKDRAEMEWANDPNNPYRYIRYFN